MEVSIQKQFSEHDKTYKQTIEKCAEIILYIDYKFIRKYYPNELGKGYTLHDLVAKYGLENVIDNWEEWREENDK